VQLRYQHGELSLMWCAVGTALLTLAALAALYSVRYERNAFADAWAYFQHSAPAQTLQNVAAAAQPEAPAIQKCTVNGKVVYSNSDCNAKGAVIQKVDVQYTAGIEAPKLPPAPKVEAGTPGNMTDKAIERATATVR
jgi:hypothetical protein